MILPWAMPTQKFICSVDEYAALETSHPSLCCHMHHCYLSQLFNAIMVDKLFLNGLQPQQIIHILQALSQ